MSQLNKDRLKKEQELHKAKEDLEGDEELHKRETQLLKQEHEDKQKKL